MKIHLQEMTKELARRYFRQFEMDPALFADIRQFRPYVYSESACDETVERNKRLGRIYWAVMLDDEPIGELVLKNINLDEQHCTLGICMRSDAFKNKGYGTQAELLALDYAFNTMELSTVYADSLIGNTRSQHVLKKVGFQDTGRDANFIYYVCKKADWKAPETHQQALGRS